MNRYTVLIILTIFGTLLSSIIPCQDQPIWFTQYLGLLFFLNLGIAIFIWKFNKIFSAFSLLSLLSTFFITHLNPRAVVLLFQINTSLLACYGISKLDKKQRQYICYGIIGVVLLQLFWLMLQYFNKDPIFHSLTRKGYSEMVGFNGAKDQIGAFFAITLPIIIRYVPILIPFSLIAVAFSHSSFAFVATIASGLIYLFYTKRLYFNAALASVVVISAVFFTSVDKLNPKDFKQRFDVWKYSIKSTVQGQIGISDGVNKVVIKTNPIYGYGLGNFLRIFPYMPTPKGTCFNVVDEKFTHAHNDYVEAFFEFGWIGFILMTVFAFTFVFSFITSSKSRDIVLYFSCLVSYFLNASGNFLSHLGVSGLFLILFYGMYRGVLNDKG